MSHLKDKSFSFDERRTIIIPGGTEETIRFCAEQFITTGQHAIKNHNFFAVALSGGQTPNAIYKTLSEPENRDKLDWTKVICFWSDERSVPTSHPENNYKNAMEAGLGKLPLLEDHIFRMQAEGDIEKNAAAYEAQIRLVLPSLSFDLMMLGMGEDGHTASLFPKTEALHSKARLVVANHVPQLDTWRMTLTYDCINASKAINIYALGKKKAEMVKKVLSEKLDPDSYPIQNVGTVTHKALWILDNDSASLLQDNQN